MMKSAELDFGKLEKLIFDYVCDYARNITATILQNIDEELMRNRDRSIYRLKDSIKTSIKTMYGEVEYKRRYYFNNDMNTYEFLLDKKMGIHKNGLFSVNMTELIVKECMNESYRKAAEDISKATAQTVSSVGAWKLVQQVGKYIESDEEQYIKDMNRGIKLGAKKVDVLFQEADGVWLNSQKDKKKAPKMELKISTVYEGWKDSNRHELINKKVIAGVESGKKFMRRKDAFIRSIYNYDDIEYRLMNSDGAGWITSGNEKLTYHQLDQFHLYQEITRKIPDKKIRNMIIESLFKHDTDRVLEIINMYADSVDNNNKKDKRAKDARDLYKYIYNNKDGLMLYKDKINLPEPKPGMVYRNMGIQENQNCTYITMRMKHRRMRWSVQGANNLVKVICSNANGDLEKYISKSFEATVPVDMINIDETDIIASAKMPRTSGTGSAYIDMIKVAVPVLHASSEYKVGKLMKDIINHI